MQETLLDEIEDPEEHEKARPSKKPSESLHGPGHGTSVFFSHNLHCQVGVSF